jgi:hypothetical protein
MMKRIDLIFSYWIFAWFIAYYFFGYKYYNPLLLLVIGFIVNIIMLIKFIINNNYYKATLFSIVNFIIKALPIYLLRKTKIHITDIEFSVVFALVFVIYTMMITDNLIKEIVNINYSSKEINTPGMYALDRLFVSIKRIFNKIL